MEPDLVPGNMTCSYDAIEVKISFPKTAVHFVRVFALKNSLKLSTSGLLDLELIELVKFSQEALKDFIQQNRVFISRSILLTSFAYRVTFCSNYPLTF